MRLAQKPCRAKLAKDAKKIKKSGFLLEVRFVPVMKKFVIILKLSIPRTNREATGPEMDVLDTKRKTKFVGA